MKLKTNKDFTQYIPKTKYIHGINSIKSLHAREEKTIWKALKSLWIV